MGAWSHEPFGNDDASDWVYELEESSDFALVRNVLGSILEDGGYIEATDGCVGIAAAEIVAAAHGEPNESLPEPVTGWVLTHASGLADTDLTLALAAVDRILADDSELPALWRESSDGSWAKSVQGFRRRLSS